MTVYIKKIQTPVGTMYGGASERGVCFVEFIEDDKLARAMERLSKELHADLVPGENDFLMQLEKELSEYFDKKRTEFSVPLHLTGTDFQKSVWNTLLEIPHGKTWTYKQQAIHINNLKAIRAMAAANGQNRHAIIIPCHRVIGSNGSLTGYAGGLEKKAWLLKFEMDTTGHSLELPFE